MKLGYNTEFDTGFIEETFAVSVEGKEILDPLKDFKNINTPTGKHPLRDALATLKLYNAIQNKEKDEIDIERE